jgi:uncharacterized LabA/DUF88 family protein
MAEERPKRLAVLIDADNASAKIVDGLFEEIAKLGEAVVRWIYGDVSSTRFKEWAKVLVKHAIVPKQQFANTTGKNASDITLVIEAMDLLHSGLYDGFCLVSSDSDFTRLASRLREQGVVVYGFGEQRTPESFRQACSRFIYTENLVASPRPVTARTKADDPLKLLEATIVKIISEAESSDGSVSLSAVGNRLASLYPDFDPRTFGFKKLSDLARSVSVIELLPEGSHPRLRLKPDPASLRPAAKRKT